MGGPPQGIGEGGWDAAAATSEAERPRDARRQRVLEGRRRLLGRVPRRLPPPGRRQRASGRRESRWRAGASRLAQVGRGAGRPPRGAWGAPRPSQAAGPPPPSCSGRIWIPLAITAPAVRAPRPDHACRPLHLGSVHLERDLFLEIATGSVRYRGGAGGGTTKLQTPRRPGLWNKVELEELPPR